MKTTFKTHKKTVTVSGPVKAGHEFDLDDAIKDIMIAHPNKSITIDLTDCPFMNSAALGVILHAHLDLAKKGRRIKLYRPSRDVVKLLDITKLDTILNVVEDRGDDENN